MLSRKKTKNEVSKPAEVQGKYVKKETSPLLRSECRAPRPHLAGAATGCGDPGGVPDAAPRGFAFLFGLCGILVFVFFLNFIMPGVVFVV